MSYQDNRPARCGIMRAALQTVKIDLDSAVKFYADPEFHALLLAAAQQVAAYAGEILATERTMTEDDQKDFEQYLAALKSGTDAPGTHRADYPRTVRNSYVGLTAADAAGEVMLQLRIESPADAAIFLASAREARRWDNGWGYVLYHEPSDRYSIYAYEPVSP